MSQQYIQRVLTRQFLGPNVLGDLLSSQLDATPYNNPGSKIFVQDVSGNMTSFVYVYTANLVAMAAGVPMYWYDVTRTNATDNPASAVTNAASTNAAAQSAAGVALNTLTTATPYGWLACGGYMSALAIPASVAVGDKLVLSNAIGTTPTADTWVRVGNATAVANAEVMTSMYAVITSAANTPSAGGFIMGSVALP